MNIDGSKSLFVLSGLVNKAKRIKRERDSESGMLLLVDLVPFSTLSPKQVAICICP